MHTIATCLKNAFDPTVPPAPSSPPKRSSREWDHLAHLVHRKRRPKPTTPVKENTPFEPALLEPFKQCRGPARVQQIAQLSDLKQLTHVLGHVSLDNDDDTIIETCRQADLLNHPHAVQLLRSIAPYLDKTLPRLVNHHVLQIQNHRAVLEGLVLHCSGPVTIKLVQQFSPPLRQTLINDMLALRPWSPHSLHVVEKALGQQPLLATVPVDELLHVIRLGVRVDPKGKGYMQLLLTLTSKYGAMLANHLDAVEEVASSSEMFLKRAVLGQVASLRKKI
ncbi:hypothetical protein BJV82DRAFT_582790 [Fennellomyces sp. T-0311]|nr:hypothetical protein BJV82DRAFT_582790 [Fennellomyces sp. T-0311]